MVSGDKTHIVGLWGRMRGYFLAGLLVVAPIGITFWLSWLVLTFIDARVTPLIPHAYNPNTYVPFGIPGLGVLVLVLFITFIGVLTRVLLGRWMLRGGEHLLSRMPVVRSLYSATKQIVSTVLAHQSDAFRQVVLFEYPRRGSWAIGFVTGTTVGEVQNVTADDVVNVFLPTTPNPTSGYLLFLPRRELVVLSMTVEEGIKMIISGGILTPEDGRSVAARAEKSVNRADGDTPTITSGDKRPADASEETADAD